MDKKYKFKVSYGILWGFWQLSKHFKTETAARLFASGLRGEWCIRDNDTDKIIDNSLNYKS